MRSGRNGKTAKLVRATREARTAGAKTMRDRYFMELRRWIGGANRVQMRSFLRVSSRRRRVRAMHMAIFYAVGDHLVRVGCIDPMPERGSVGECVNTILREGVDAIPPNRRRELAPLVRLYQRTLPLYRRMERVSA